MFLKSAVNTVCQNCGQTVSLPLRSCPNCGERLLRPAWFTTAKWIISLTPCMVFVVLLCRYGICPGTFADNLNSAGTAAWLLCAAGSALLLLPVPLPTVAIGSERIMFRLKLAAFSKRLIMGYSAVAVAVVLSGAATSSVSITAWTVFAVAVLLLPYVEWMGALFRIAELLLIIGLAISSR